MTHVPLPSLELFYFPTTRKQGQPSSKLSSFQLWLQSASFPLSELDIPLSELQDAQYPLWQEMRSGQQKDGILHPQRDLLAMEFQE